MHICVVSPGYPTTKTIDFVFVDQLCRALADKGEEITIIVPQSLSKSILRGVPISPIHSLLNTSLGNSIHLYRPIYLSLGGRWGLLRKIGSRGYYKALRRSFLRLKHKPDVCYGHFWDSVYALLPLAKEYGIPLIASSGEESVTIQKEHSLSKLSILTSYVRGVISVSTKNKTECIEAGLVKDEDCVVIPNAVNTDLFFQKDKAILRKQYGFAADIFIVAFVGQFNQRKGVEILSKALTVLNDDSVKAIFMGTGPEIPHYNGTLLAKTIEHDLLPDYINCADVFVLPTLNEGCSNAIIEAMACGLPIISSDRSFNYDILNKENSILVDPLNINQIAKAIKELKDNPVKIKALSALSLKAVSDLTLSKRADKVRSFIKTKI
jgi:teichuronic acid biosynthesis glycosyltransferase TuaC